MLSHVSSVPVTGPSFLRGHFPVAALYSSAQARIFLMVSDGRFMWLRTPRCSANSLTSEEPPGSPRAPVWSAESTIDQVSSPVASISPDSLFGHRLCCRWLFVLHPSISADPSARSDRKQGLAKLRLDDGPPRSCGTRAGRQLQHCRALAIAQARD